MKRRTGVLLLVAGLLVGSLGTLFTTVAGRWLMPSLPSAVTAEHCDVDATVSGFQGYCVQTKHRAAGLFNDEQTIIAITAISDGGALPREAYAPFPFNDPDTDYTFTFGDDAITITDGEITVTYPASYYEITT